MNLQEQISRITKLINIISETEVDYFSEFMKLGTNSDQIEELQDLLGLDEITGTFDEKTEKCVKEFQEFSQINVDGVVGPETRTKLNELLGNELPGWKGCGGTANITQEVGNNIENGPSVISSKDIVGSEWRSCKSWTRNGGLNKWGDRIKISKSPSEFKISYEGPTSGVSMAHATGGGDTIHQVYNILVCEINPFLSQGGMKPDLDGINIQGGKSSKGGTITIRVPLMKTDGVYQLDRRGGWNHDPKSNKMSNKCRKINKSGKECIGPVTKIITAPFGKITEYFITHQV